MKRFKVMGLCLVAAFALCAVVASAASAALPEYAICAKTAKNAEKKYTGKFVSKTCSPEASPAEQAEGKKNKYEISLGIGAAKKTGFKGKNEGTPKNILVSPVHCSSGKLVLGSCAGTFEPGASKPASEAGVTECLKEKVEGSVTSAKNTVWHTVYSKCKGEGSPANTTGSKKAEEITTDNLESTLVYTNSTKSAAGLKVKGLGPGGRLAQYEIKALGIDVEVFGEVIAKQEGNFNVANKTVKAVVGHGPLELQSTLYAEESFTEEQGKEFFETALALEKCEKGEAPFPAGPHSMAECESFGVVFKEPQPTMLISVISGAINTKAPAVQNGTTINKGEAFLVAG